MKRFIIVMAILIPVMASATVFVSEDWETGTPTGCWPCKTESCSTEFRGWSTDFPSTAPTAAGLSTTRNHTSGGTRSYYNYKPAGSTDGCPITYDLPTHPTTIYVRFYMYMDAGFSSWGSTTGDPMIHWTFTNSQRGSTGFRLNLVNNSHYGLCPKGNICLLPEGDGGSEWWAGRGSPSWDAQPIGNYSSYIGAWHCFEFKMQISGSNVILTEWIDGVQKRGPITGPGSNNPYFDKVIFHLYAQNYSPNVSMSLYLDDIVVSDVYIGPSVGPPIGIPTNLKIIGETLNN